MIGARSRSGTGYRTRPRFVHRDIWLPICDRLRTRPGWVEPEVYFRIAHLAQVGHSGAPVATYREQTVEIALGPKGAFENGNMGVLTRRVATDWAVSAIPPSRGIPKPPKETRTPRVVELLRKAIEWQGLLDAGKIANQAEIARREGITRARVTQVMRLLRLAPEFQEQILSMPDISRRSAITETQLRPMIIVAEGARREKPIASLMP